MPLIGATTEQSDDEGWQHRVLAFLRSGVQSQGSGVPALFTPGIHCHCVVANGEQCVVTGRRARRRALLGLPYF